MQFITCPVVALTLLASATVSPFANASDPSPLDIAANEILRVVRDPQVLNKLRAPTPIENPGDFFAPDTLQDNLVPPQIQFVRQAGQLFINSIRRLGDHTYWAEISLRRKFRDQSSADWAQAVTTVQLQAQFVVGPDKRKWIRLSKVKARYPSLQDFIWIERGTYRDSLTTSVLP